MATTFNLDDPAPVKKKKKTLSKKKGPKVMDEAAIIETPVPEKAEKFILANIADEDCVGLVIEYEKGRRSEAARDAYVENYDPSVKRMLVKVSVCGCSATFRSVDELPLHDVQCPCGRHNHLAIKYVLKK